jgi:putative oxidoreductase
MKVSNLYIRIIQTSGDKKVLVLRFIVGLVFLSEGIQKFLFPGSLGTARFERIGFADPAFWAYFTGTFEVLCGLMVLLGMAVRVTAIPLIIIMLTAFVTTKWPLLINKGFWTMAHEYRTDFSMTLLLVLLLITGAGRWSVDFRILKRTKSFIDGNNKK